MLPQKLLLKQKCWQYHQDSNSQYHLHLQAFRQTSYSVVLCHSLHWKWEHHLLHIVVGYSHWPNVHREVLLSQNYPGPRHWATETSPPLFHSRHPPYFPSSLSSSPLLILVGLNN